MGRNVIVSGGGTGIGRAIARRFVDDGDDVVIIGRREAVVSTTAHEINHEAGRPGVHAVAGDLSQAEHVERIAGSLPLDGPIDVLINNAGGVFEGNESGLEGAATEWEGDFRGNVLTGVLLTTALEPRLRRPGASVVNISSIAALAGGGDSYSGAKAAIIGWTLDLAMRLGGEGIRVNAVVPAYVTETEFFGDRMTEDRHERLIARTLLGRAGTPEDVAGAVAFLASEDAAYVTGQLLHVNGGALLGR
jgi:3-oxoacyl-[acyl-carrier protein] reductase